MANPLFGGMSNLGMRPIGAPTPNVQPSAGYLPQPANRYYNSYATAPMPQGNPMIPANPVNNILNTMQAITPQSNLIWVNNPDEIPNHVIGRGWQQWFGDKNEPKLYIREMDMNGVMQPLQTVWVSFTDPNAAQQTQQSQPVSPSVQAPAQQEVSSSSNQNAQIPVSAPQTTSARPTREEFDDLAMSVQKTNANVEEMTRAVSELTGKLSDFLK